MQKRHLGLVSGLLLAILTFGCGVEDPTFDARTGSIQIISTPDELTAAIYHQGPEDLKFSLADSTPKILDLLEPGKHLVKLELPGYFTTPDFLQCEVTAGEISVVDFQLEPNLGSLAVTSAPEGAAIIVDDLDQGLVTPGTVEGLDPGDHVVTVALDGYEPDPVSRTVTIALDQVATAYFTLESTAPPVTKIVLLEGFSNVCCDGCPAMNETLHEFLDTAGYGPDRVLLVKWAVDFPLWLDPHYQDNIDDNDARAWGPGYDGTGYYADDLGSVPTLFGDGTLLGDSGNPPDLLTLPSLVDALLDEQPGFGIQVEAAITGTSVAVTATLTAVEPVDVADCSINFVLVQNPVEYDEPACTYGEEEYVFHWIMRDFYKDELAQAQLAVGTPLDLSTTLTSDLDWPAEDMYVIAFVQNDMTRHVLQAGSNIPAKTTTISFTAPSLDSLSPLAPAGGQP